MTKAAPHTVPRNADAHLHVLSLSRARGLLSQPPTQLQPCNWSLPLPSFSKSVPRSQNTRRVGAITAKTQSLRREGERCSDAGHCEPRRVYHCGVFAISTKTRSTRLSRSSSSPWSCVLSGMGTVWTPRAEGTPDVWVCEYGRFKDR